MNRDVVRAVKKAAVLALLVAATLVLLAVLPVKYSDFMSAVINKRDLLRDGRRDRVVFVGGSGLLDGLDSRLVAERLRRPVVNMGLYGGFGVTPLLREITPYLRPGDVVVIIPEYSILFDTPDFHARRWLLALDPVRNWRLYRQGRLRALSFVTDVIALLRSKVQAFPQEVLEALRTRSLAPFHGEGYVFFGRYFNEYGDSLRIMQAAVPGQIEQRGRDIFAVEAYRDQSFAAVNAFCRDMDRQGIRTFFVFPAFPLGEYRFQERGMRQYEARLRKELACTILGSPGDFLYPYSLFTNTVHHINSEARRMRTERVLGYLEKSIGTAANGGNAAIP